MWNPAAFCFAVAIMYGITDLGAVVDSNGAFPLAVVYSQATGSKGATFGLLLIVLFSAIICALGTFLTVSSSFPKVPPAGVKPGSLKICVLRIGQSHLVGFSARQRYSLRSALFSG